MAIQAFLTLEYQVAVGVACPAKLMVVFTVPKEV